MSISGDAGNNSVLVLVASDGTVNVTCDDRTIIEGIKNMRGMDAEFGEGNDTFVFHYAQSDLDFLLERAHVNMGPGADTATMILGNPIFLPRAGFEVDIEPGSDPGDLADVRIAGLRGGGKGSVAIEELKLEYEGLVLDNGESALEIGYARGSRGNRNVAVQIEGGSINPDGGSLTVELGDSAGRTYVPFVFRKRIDKSSPLIAKSLVSTEWNPEDLTQRMQQSTMVRQLNDGLIGVGNDLLIQTANGSGDTVHFQCDLRLPPSEEVEVSVTGFNHLHRLLRGRFSKTFTDGDEGKVTVDASVADGSLMRLDVGAVGFDEATVAAFATRPAALDLMLVPAPGKGQGEQLVDVDLDLEMGGEVNVNVHGLSPSEATRFGSIKIDVGAPRGSLVADVEIAELFIPETNDEVLVAFEMGDPRNDVRVKLSGLRVVPSQIKVVLLAPLIGDFEFAAQSTPGSVEPIPSSLELLFDNYEAKGSVFATLDWVAYGLDTSFRNQLRALGDRDRPLITGRLHQARKPLLVIAEDIEGEAVHVEWSKSRAPEDGGTEIEPGGDEFPNLNFQIASKLPDRVLEFESEHVPELDVRITSPDQQLALNAFEGRYHYLAHELTHVRNSRQVVELTGFHSDGTPLRAKIEAKLEESETTVTVDGLFAARKTGDRFSVDVTSPLPQPFAVSATSLVQHDDGSSTASSADVTGTFQGGRIGVTLDANKMDVEMEGAQISDDFQQTLTVENNSPPRETGASIEFTGKVKLSDVSFNNSRATIDVVGDAASVILDDVNVVEDSRLDLVVQTDGASAGRTRYHDITLKRGYVANSALSLSSFGSPDDDRVRLFIADTLVEQDARLLINLATLGANDVLFAGAFNTVVDGSAVLNFNTGAGGDKFGGVFGFDGDGRVTINVQLGDGPDQATVLARRTKRLSATLDAGADDDGVLARNVKVRNAGPPIGKPSQGDDEAREQAFLAWARQLLESEELSYDILAVEALASGIFTVHDER